MIYDTKVRHAIYVKALTLFDEEVYKRKKETWFYNCRGICGCLGDAAFALGYYKYDPEYPEIEKHNPNNDYIYWFPRQTQEDIDVRRKILIDAIKETEL